MTGLIFLADLRKKRKFILLLSIILINSFCLCVDSLKEGFNCKFEIGCVYYHPGQGTMPEIIVKNCETFTMDGGLSPNVILDQYYSKEFGQNVNPRISIPQHISTVFKFLESNKLSLRGQAFIFNDTPEWFFKENFNDDGNYVSKDIMNQRLENFIKNTFEFLGNQFPEVKFYAYDICYEIFSDEGGLKKDLGWSKIYNDEEYIINAFTYAKKYAPKDLKLFINENNEFIPKKTTDIYNIAMKLKEKGVIDGIGIESFISDNIEISDYEKALETFISTGLEIHITKLDSILGAQKNTIQSILELAVKYSDSITSVSFDLTRGTREILRPSSILSNAPCGNNNSN